MANLLYVAVPLAFTIMVAVVISLARRRPRSMENAMEAFSRELGALAPGPRPSGNGSRTKKAKSIG